MADDSPVRSGSLRRRVMLSVVALLFVVLVALGILVDVILARRLHDDLRQRLVERADYAAVLSARGVTGQQLVNDLNGQGIIASVQSGGQLYVGQNRPLGDDPNNAGPGGRPPGRPPSQQSAATPTVTVTSHGSQLYARVDLGSSSLLLTTSEADIGHTMNVLRTVELVAGSVTLLVGAGLSFAVVRTALSPLRRMAELADRIRAGDRGRRLRPRNPKTDLGRTAAALDGMLDSLESAEAEAQRAEIRMRRFLGDASHDLRTPLAVMVAGAEQLLRSDPGRAERERRLVALIREGRRAGRLVDDLLLMARLDEQEAALRWDVLELGEVVTTAVERLRLVVRDRRITLDAQSAVTVRGDVDRLARLLANLLENARGATAVGGHISVSVQAVDGLAVVDVRDDGPGVPADQRARIFDRFVRLDESRARASGDDLRLVVDRQPPPSDQQQASGGSGLGLPIAQAIARGHHGDLRCLAAEIGAHFRLELPAIASTHAVDLKVVAAYQP